MNKTKIAGSRVGHTRRGDNKTRQISVAFNNADSEKIEQVCRERGCACAAFIRESVLLRLKSEVMPA